MISGFIANESFKCCEATLTKKYYRPIKIYKNYTGHQDENKWAFSATGLM